jgi:hypothetical protein
MILSAVRTILLRNAAQIAKSRGLTGKQMMQKAAQHLDTMRSEWFTGEAPNIAYEDPVCRWAYMFMHAAVQANLFQKVLWECEVRSKAFRRKLDGEDLSVVVLGGGPGTELLGLAKHYLSRADDEEERVQTEVRIDIIDRVSAWSENVSWIKEEISKDYSKRFGKRGNWPALFDVNSLPLNFSDLDGFGNISLCSAKTSSCSTTSSQRYLTSMSCCRLCGRWSAAAQWMRTSYSLIALTARPATRSQRWSGSSGWKS